MSKRFEFPLEALRRHKTYTLNHAKKEFLAIQNKILEKTESLKTMLAQKTELMTQEALHKKTLPSLAMQPLLLDMQRKRIDNIGREILALEEELERHRRWLSEINKELKALDKLEEKQHQRWEKAKNRKEQNQRDAWVTIQWSRRSDVGGME